MVRHKQYPEVEMSEREFERMLALVDALDPIQLLRLQCRVQSLQGDPPSEGRGPGEDTIPPPRGQEPEGQEQPTGEYEDLKFDFDDDTPVR